MAQNSTHPQGEADNTEAADAPLPAAVRKRIDGVRSQFLDFVKGFSGLAVKRETVAAPFMKAFAAYQQAREGATFVDFCREVDGSIPLERSGKNGYKANRAYQAADYLRRLYATQQAQKEGRQARTGPTPTKPLDAVARLVASILPIIPEDQQDKVFKAMKEELHWTDKQVERVRSILKSVAPLIVASAPKGTAMPHLRVRIERQAEESVAA